YVAMFSRRHAVIAQDSFGHHVGGAAEITDADRFAAEVRHCVNLRLGEKIKNQVLWGQHDQLHGHSSYRCHDALRQPVGVIQVTSAQRIHSDRYSDQNMFRSQAVFCVESLFLGDDGWQEAGGVSGESDADFLLRANFRSGEKRQKKKADHQKTRRGLLHDSLKAGWSFAAWFAPLYPQPTPAPPTYTPGPC